MSYYAGGWGLLSALDRVIQGRSGGGQGHMGPNDGESNGKDRENQMETGLSGSD